MTRIAILVALACSACVLDPSRHKRPSRMQIGANARHFTAPMGSGPESRLIDQQVAFRTSNPPPKEMTTSHQAASISGQFTQGMRHGLYLGGELEAGMLDVAGSSTAGAYGIFGFEHMFAAGSIGGELASGWRSVRYTTDADDLSTLVVEPRVRASVWLGEQTSLAVTGGMTLDDRPAFVAGVSIGIHQNPFDKFGR